MDGSVVVGVQSIITLHNGTTIHHNVTNGRSDTYGLETYDSSSSIHLASSLTIETISKNNGGGGNHGGPGTIKILTEKELLARKKAAQEKANKEKLEREKVVNKKVQ